MLSGHLRDLRWAHRSGRERHSLTSPLGRIFCSSSLKAVPILLLTMGGSSPGSRGYSRGSFPVSSCKQKMLLVLWEILQQSKAHHHCDPKMTGIHLQHIQFSQLINTQESTQPCKLRT